MRLKYNFISRPFVNVGIISQHIIIVSKYLMTTRTQAASKPTGGFNAEDYVREGVTLDEVLEIKTAFDLFDADKGGAIEPKEIKDAMNSLGLETRAAAVYHMIAEIDKDGGGTIDFGEFFDLMTTPVNENESREDVHKVFVTFDDEKTGYISAKNLKRAAKELGEFVDDAFFDAMIERADFDLDGYVSEEEFYNILTKKTFAHL